jgi:hypothetical protein
MKSFFERSGLFTIGRLPARQDFRMTIELSDGRSAINRKNQIIENQKLHSEIVNRQIANLPLFPFLQVRAHQNKI